MRNNKKMMYYVKLGTKKCFMSLTYQSRNQTIDDFCVFNRNVVEFIAKKSWTLISRHMRNFPEKCFSANVPKVLIFGLLVQGTNNDFRIRTGY